MRNYRRPYSQKTNRNRPRRAKSKREGFASILLTFLIFSSLIAIIIYLSPDEHSNQSYTGSPYIVDGDTLSMGQARIRLKGIDAPEMDQTCERGGSSYFCGIDARNILRSKIGRESIRCESAGKDQYGRVLARCYSGELDLNGWMVQQGWAVAYGSYNREENEARNNRQGLWAGQFVRPSLWRKEHSRKNEETPSSTPDAMDRLSAYIKERIDALINLF